MNRLLRCAILLFLVMTLPMTALAHPGKTDSKGGHTDWSTGEYHYHHGYSAHQHYDMDGDGKDDCPYDFKDATDHRSGSSNSGTGKSNYITSPTTSATEPPTPSTVPIAPKTTKKEEAKHVPAWIYWCFGILLASILWMLLKIRAQKEDMEILQNSHSRELDHLHKKQEQTIRQMSEKQERNLQEKEATDKEIADAIERLERANYVLSSTWGKIYKAQSDLHNLKEQIVTAEADLEKAKADRLIYKNAPPDVTFAKDGKPVFWKSDQRKPYGDYTIYVKPGSEVYHTDRLCASYFAKEAHIFDYINKRRPCLKCARNSFDFTDLPEWYTGNDRISDRSDL